MTYRLKLASSCAVAVLMSTAARAQAPDRAASPGSVVSEVVVTADAFGDGSTPESGGVFVANPSFGPFGPTSDKDVPFSSLSIPQVVLQDQQVHSAADALKNDPSVIAFQPAIGRTQSYQVRGFGVGPSYGFYQDGLDLLNDGNPAVEADERIDVLKGAASVLYGFAAPGGLVQFASKLPLSTNLGRLDAGYISDGTATEQLDISRRFGPGGQFGARVNVYQQDGDTSVDQTHEDRGVQALSLDWRPVTGVRLWTNLQHNSTRIRGGDEAFFFTGAQRGLPVAPDGSNLYGEPYFFSHVSTSLGETGLDVQRDGWTLNAAVGFSTTPNRFLGGFDGAPGLNNLGQFGAEPLQGSFSYNNFSYRVLLARTLAAGSVTQTFSVVLDGSTHLIHVAQRVNAAATEVSSFSDPVYYARPVLPAYPTTTSREDIRLDSQFATDKVDFGRYVSLIGGAIRSGVSDVNAAVPSGVISSQIYQNKVTPIAALEVHPSAEVSVYASFIQALQEGAESPNVGVINPNVRLAPFIGDQYEVGVKAQVVRGLELNAALFRVDQANAATVALSATQNIFTEDGTQRNQGVEVTLVGRVIPDLTLLGGVTALTSKIDGANGLGFAEANGVPDVKANLYGEYALPFLKGLTLLTGVYYTDRVPFLTNSAANVALGFSRTLNVPSNIRVDVGAKYAWVTRGLPLTLSAYVENASNERFFVNSGSTLVVGDPLSGRLTLGVAF